MVARAGSTRRKRSAPEEASSDNGEVRVTGLHNAHADWLEAEYGAEVNATDIAWVYKTRNEFRKSNTYADYLDERDAEKEAAENAKAAEPKRKRGRPATKRAAADDEDEPDDEGEDADEAPAAAPARRGRRAATKAPASNTRSRARKPAAPAEDEEESAPAATPARRGRGRAKKDGAQPPF